MRLFDGDGCRGAAARIRIGGREGAEARTRRLERQSLVGIYQRIVFGRVTVRPAIDRDAGDVACRIEAAASQRAAELAPDVALEGQIGSASCRERVCQYV